MQNNKKVKGLKREYLSKRGSGLSFQILNNEYRTCLR
jgi:hypothetical protein